MLFRSRLVSQEEKRLDRACKTTMVPLNFNAGRIVRQEADRISIDLRSFYQSLGKLPEAKLTAALDEFLAKGIIGLLARANQRYLCENPTRQKVFLQLLRQLPDRRYRQHRDDRGDGQPDRGDQQGARRSVAATVVGRGCHEANSKGGLRRRWGKSACG